MIFKPAINATAPVIWIAKLKNLSVGEATSNILKSMSGGDFLSLIDMHGHGLPLKILCFSSKKVLYQN